MFPMNYLEDFLVAKTAAGLSPRTVTWYAGLIARWLAAFPAPEAQPREIEAYLSALRARLAPATVAGHHRALSVWFAWLVEAGALSESPMRLLRRPKIPVKPIHYVTPDDLASLIAAIPVAAWIDARDRALVLLLYYTGLRVGEVVRLRMGDVDFGQRLLLVRQSKGGVPRLAPFAADVSPALLDYLYRRPPCEGTALWLSDDGAGGARGVITDNGIRQMLRRRCAEAGLRYLNPHAFRHGYAMWTLNAGMELSAVAAAMGHKNTQITQQTYARWLPSGLLSQYDAATARLRGLTR